VVPTSRPAQLFVLTFFVLLVGSSTWAQQPLEPDQLPLSSAPSAQGRSAHVPPRLIGPNGAATLAPGAASATTTTTSTSIDTVLTFSGSYLVGPSTARKKFFFTMVGHGPGFAGTTTLNAPIIPVSLDLRNADGSPRFVNGHRLFYDVTPFIAQLLASPMFQNAHYSSSGRLTQFADAVQRAEFHSAASAWHTVLKPLVKTKRVMKLAAGSYKFALKKDGTCCAYVLVDSGTFNDELFPSSASDRTSIAGQALHAGDIRTRDVTTFFFPNTFLTNPDSSFVFIGFHSFFSLPGTAQNGNREQRFVMNFSSWVTPFVFFGDAFQDVTAVSYELVELINDPFVDNITPWWKAPNGNCQNLLEPGDVLEDLPNATFPVKTSGKTFHPQNEALLQWFEFQKPSHAIAGAYSYPDERLLMSLSRVEPPGCQ